MSFPPRKFTVVVADPEPVARFGIVQLLMPHPQMRVSDEAENVAAARVICVRDRPDVLLIDPAMPDAFAFIEDLPQWSSQTRTVVFTLLADAFSVQRAFKAGAYGYVNRCDPISALLGALVGALSGERHVSARSEHVLLERLASGAVQMNGVPESALSNREMEIFRMIGNGIGTRAIAEELHLSVKTIDTHRQRIKEKLHLPTGTELQRRAAVFVRKSESETSTGKTSH